MVCHFGLLGLPGNFQSTAMSQARPRHAESVAGEHDDVLWMPPDGRDLHVGDVLQRVRHARVLRDAGVIIVHLRRAMKELRLRIPEIRGMSGSLPETSGS